MFQNSAARLAARISVPGEAPRDVCVRVSVSVVVLLHGRGRHRAAAAPVVERRRRQGAVVEIVQKTVVQCQ